MEYWTPASALVVAAQAESSYRVRLASIIHSNHMEPGYGVLDPC